MFSLVLRVFACTYFVQDIRLGLDKLFPRCIMCVFVGYSKTQKGCHCFDLFHRKYFTSGHVTFLRLFHSFLLIV